MLRLSRVAIDTSIIIEYIDMKGEYHEEAELIFREILNGRIEAIVPHPILAETYYVAVKLYDKLKIMSSHDIASKLIEWLYRLPTLIIPREDINLAIEAGKAKLEFNIALTDCYVLAVSKICGCKSLFKKREKEMLKSMDILEKKYQLIFLEDYK